MKIRHITLSLATAALLIAGSASSSIAADQKTMAGDMRDPFMQAEMQMHDAMMMKAKDADPSRAWTLKMIEHHRGAIAMSKIVLQHDPDPEIRKMAEKTIAKQEKEIGEMQAWLKHHPR